MNIENLEWVKESNDYIKLRWRANVPNPYKHKVFAAVAVRHGALAWVARDAGRVLTGDVPCESVEDGMKQAETHVALTNYDQYLRGTK